MLPEHTPRLISFHGSSSSQRWLWICCLANIIPALEQASILALTQKLKDPGNLWQSPNQGAGDEPLIISSAHPQKPSSPAPRPSRLLPTLFGTLAGWTGRPRGVWWDTVLFLSPREELAPLQGDFWPENMGSLVALTLSFGLWLQFRNKRTNPTWHPVSTTRPRRAHSCGPALPFPSAVTFSVDSGVSLSSRNPTPGFRAWLCHLLGDNHLPSSPLDLVGGQNELIFVKHLKQCLAHSEWLQEVCFYLFSSHWISHLTALTLHGRHRGISGEPSTPSPWNQREAQPGTCVPGSHGARPARARRGGKEAGPSLLVWANRTNGIPSP